MTSTPMDERSMLLIQISVCPGKSAALMNAENTWAPKIIKNNIADVRTDFVRASFRLAKVSNPLPRANTSAPSTPENAVWSTGGGGGGGGGYNNDGNVGSTGGPGVVMVRYAYTE